VKSLKKAISLCSLHLSGNLDITPENIKDYQSILNIDSDFDFLPIKPYKNYTNISMAYHTPEAESEE
jgi:hypothetical protein